MSDLGIAGPKQGNEPPRDERGRFPKGVSGNSAGRPGGIANKATLEAKTFARAFVNDEAYRKNLRHRIMAGKAQHIDTLLWHYAYGRPADKTEFAPRAPFVILHREWGPRRDPLAKPATEPAGPDDAVSVVPIKPPLAET